MTDHKQLIERLFQVQNQLTPGTIDRADLDGMAFTVLEATAAILSLITEPDERAQEAEDLGEQANRWRNEYGVWRERAETAEAQRDELREALEPFDDALGEDDEFGDETPLRLQWGRTIVMMVLGDLRRARQALHNTTNQREEAQS